jgi:hypothetical protein
VTTVEDYRRTLRDLAEWEPFLLEQSALPGPRANLELAAAAAEEAEQEVLRRWAAVSPDAAPFGSTEEFLPVCGAIGLGRLLADGDRSALVDLRRLAVDPRWRVREAVAIALQRFGDVDFPALLTEMQRWARGSLLERRAAVAALCEPRLLSDPNRARDVLTLLGRVTAELEDADEHRSDAFRVLRQTLGYAWSVAIVALPEEGKALLERLLASRDRDVRWIVRANLRKRRLVQLDADWVALVERHCSSPASRKG